MPFVYIYLALPYPNMSYCLRYFGSPCIKQKKKKNIGSDSKNKEEELMTKIHGSMIL